MPPLPVILNTFRCTFHWTNTDSDEDVVSVQHFRCPGGIAVLAAALDSDVQTHQFEGLTDATAALSVDIIELDGVSASQPFVLANWAGESGSGDTLPGFNILVEGFTGLRGSANRGRIFLPSPIETIITDGLIDVANQVEIQTAWEDYVTALAADDVEWGVASYVHEEFNPYTSVNVPRMLGVIRRRRNVS